MNFVTLPTTIGNHACYEGIVVDFFELLSHISRPPDATYHSKVAKIFWKPQSALYLGSALAYVADNHSYNHIWEVFDENHKNWFVQHPILTLLRSEEWILHSIFSTIERRFCTQGNKTHAKKKKKKRKKIKPIQRKMKAWHAQDFHKDFLGFSSYSVFWSFSLYFRLHSCALLSGAILLQDIQVSFLHFSFYSPFKFMSLIFKF